MPRVPTYDKLKVQSTPLPGARKQHSATPESEGAGVGLAIAQFGGQVSRIGIQGYSVIQEAQRQRADDIANLQVLDKFNKLDESMLRDQEHGFLTTKKGIDAHAASGQYVSDYDVQAAAIGEGLTTDAQRRYYEQMRITRGASFRANVDTHATTEYDKYEADQFQATMASSVNAAIAAGAADLATVGQQLREQERIISTHGARLGMSPEAQTLFRDEVRAKVHAGVIGNLIDTKKFGAAQTYFQETRDEIAKGDPEAVARITKALEAGTELAEAQQAADKILAAFRREEDARAAAKMLPPETRQRALELIEHEFNIRNAQARDDHEALVNKGLNLAERTGRWTSIPATEWAQYTVGERASLKAYLEQVVKGVPVKTDQNVYSALLQMSDGIDPRTGEANPAMVGAFLATNLLENKHRLSDSDFQEMLKRQQAVRKGQQELLTNRTAQKAMENEAIGAMGLPTNPVEPGKPNYNADTYRRVDAFRRSVREATARLEASTGKPATDAEVQSIVDQLRTSVSKGAVLLSTKGINTYGDAYAFEVAQAQAKSINDIPATEVRRLKRLLREEGGDWSDAGVLKAFNLLLTRTRKDR